MFSEDCRFFSFDPLVLIESFFLCFLFCRFFLSFLFFFRLPRLSDIYSTEIGVLLYILSLISANSYISKSCSVRTPLPHTSLPLFKKSGTLRLIGYRALFQEIPKLFTPPLQRKAQFTSSPFFLRRDPAPPADRLSADGGT